MADHEIDIGGRSHRLGLSHTLVDYGSGTAPAALMRRIAALAQPLPPNPVRLARDSVLTAELLT